MYKTLDCNILWKEKRLKITKCASRDNQLNKLWHTHATECDTAIEMIGDYLNPLGISILATVYPGRGI
jgi:hypothetical protein